jgi:bifunctional DNA-binding transcriptional regulator/antitoxin component of YhaV-PrlF toxin-antitoxin module
MGETDFEDIDGDDPVGDFTTNMVQKHNRVSIPKDYLEYLGIDIRENVFVICKDDCIVVKEAELGDIDG